MYCRVCVGLPATHCGLRKPLNLAFAHLLVGMCRDSSCNATLIVADTLHSGNAPYASPHARKLKILCRQHVSSLDSSRHNIIVKQTCYAILKIALTVALVVSRTSRTISAMNVPRISETTTNFCLGTIGGPKGRRNRSELCALMTHPKMKE